MIHVPDAPAEARPPYRDGFKEPATEPALDQYLTNVVQWHGYIQFVSVTSVRENPDVPVAQLFIEPNLARQRVSPDAPEGEWPACEPLTAAVVQHRRLVVLGDPGSGKLTFVNWLTWQLARRRDPPWEPELARLVPIPMLLRELGITPQIDWDGLLDAFLSREMARPLAGSRPLLSEMLQSGQAFLLLDGLDEVGSEPARRSLVNAVFDGMGRFPACRWILTSRIVGYEEVPFHRGRVTEFFEFIKKGWERVHHHYDPNDPWHDLNRMGGKAGFTDKPKIPRETRVMHERIKDVAKLTYVAPFNDEQIRGYARNWFAQRDMVAQRAAAHGEEFLRALYAHETVTRLARTPYILALMALIYRVKAKLPHGRAHLYQQISEAYLQIIDEYRGLRELGFPLEEKRRWLARVAFEMQLRRSQQGGPTKEGEAVPVYAGGTDVLADEAEVAGWIAEAMDESGFGRDKGAASEFLDYIVRRSGLLLPRGPNRLAFTHLSFQEYFAASYLAEQLRSLQWARSGETPDARIPKELYILADQVVWRETLIFLFEIMAHERDWHARIMEAVFGKGFERLKRQQDDAIPCAVLLALLAVDPHAVFDPETRTRAMKSCWRFELDLQKAIQKSTDDPLKAWMYRPAVAKALLNAQQEDRDQVWNALREVGAETNSLDLRDTGITDLAPITQLSALEFLRLAGTGVSMLEPLASLSKLKGLDLNRTVVSQIDPLSWLSRLEWLDLSDTRVTEIHALENLQALAFLNLSKTRVSRLAALVNLPNLRRLDLVQTAISDVDEVAEIRNLKSLDSRQYQGRQRR